MEDNNEWAKGLGNCGWTVFIIFMMLKLTNTVDWSWWWITAPIWGVVVLVVIFAIIINIMER